MLERVIQSFRQNLSSLIHDPAHSLNWEDEIADVVLSLNTTVHSSTGFSPHRIVFGFDNKTTTELVEMVSKEA